MKYNFFIFDSIELEYYQSALLDIVHFPNVKVFIKSYGVLSGIARFLFRVHVLIFRLMPKFVPLKIWRRFFVRAKFDNDNPICYLFNGTSQNMWEMDIFNYIKSLNPNNKLVVFLRDKIDVVVFNDKYATPENLKKTFDLVFTYDKKQERKYDFIWFSSFGSKEKVEIFDEPLSDLFFAGKCKDRLPMILEICKRLTQKGVKCDFCLTHVPVEDRVEIDGITYLDAFMPYKEMLFRSANTKCILELSQGGVEGFTSRFFEALMYNKKLITNNAIVKTTKFYDERFIKYFEKTEEIDADFILEQTDVEYNYDDEYSPKRLLELIEERLG